MFSAVLGSAEAKFGNIVFGYIRSVQNLTSVIPRFRFVDVRTKNNVFMANKIVNAININVKSNIVGQKIEDRAVYIFPKITVKG